MIPNQRLKFSIPDDVVYLNCAYTSPLLTAARTCGAKALESKSTPWLIQPADFFSTIEQTRGLFARLIQSEPDDVAIIPGVSYGIALAAKNLPFETGQNILVLEDQFPSNIYTWKKLCREKGGDLKIVKRPDDNDWTTAILNALDKTCPIAALPHCHWTDGTRLDLVRIGEACRQNSTALVIDGTQSLGAMPFDVNEIKPDFLVTTAHKWLLGPYSYGFCYIAPKWQQGEPLEENWLNRTGSQDFSRLVDYQDEYQDGARRYDVGEASNFLLSPIAASAINQLLDWDIARIAKTLKAKTDRIAKRARRLGLSVADDRVRSLHMIGIRFPEGVPEKILTRLAANNVYVSVRGTSIRVAPHLYNSDQDIDLFLELLDIA